MLINPAPKILILESQMIIAADISLQLSKLGFDVIGINTCSENALKTIETNRPDIVVINIEPKARGEGLKTARIIRKTFQIPVIFLSANTDRELFKEIIEAKPYAFIAIPFERKDLQRGVETALCRMAAEGLWAAY